MRFDAALAEPAPESFVNDILLQRLGISGAVVGFDFRFGHNRTGTPDLLAAEGPQRNFTVDVVPAVEIEGRRISSGVDPRGARAPAASRRRTRCSAIPGS